MLDNMSAPIPRLRNSQERLAIQLELQNTYIFNLINYFIMIKLEYKYNWDNMQKKNTFQGAFQGAFQGDYLSFHNISKFSQFMEFHNYMITNNIFDFEEAEWLEDAIQEILVE
jgi:hypothetical protein